MAAVVATVSLSLSLSLTFVQPSAAQQSETQPAESSSATSLDSILNTLVDGEQASPAEPLPAVAPTPPQRGDAGAGPEPSALSPATPGLRPEPDMTYEELQAELAIQAHLMALSLQPRPAPPARTTDSGSAGSDQTQEPQTSENQTDSVPPYPNDRPESTPVHVILSDAMPDGSQASVRSDRSGNAAASSNTPARSKQRPPKVDPSCPARLRALGVQFTELPDFRKQSGCQNVAVLDVTNFGNGVSLNPNVHVTCEVAEGMALWIRNSVQAEAIRNFGSRVVKLSNTHGYSCRYRSGGKLSEHGYANAIDIGTFHLGDGRKVGVLKNWVSDGTPFGSNAARWFDRINDSACDYFQLVLNPRSNKAHENHFHLDQGPWKSCD